MKMTVILILVGALGTPSKRFIKETAGTGAYRKNRNHIDHRMVKISLNTKQSPGDLKRLAVTQTSEKTHQLKLMILLW